MVSTNLNAASSSYHIGKLRPLRCCTVVMLRIQLLGLV